MMRKKIIGAFLLLAFGSSGFAKRSENVDPENVKYILNYLLAGDTHHLRILGKELEAELRPYKVLEAKKKTKADELGRLSHEVYQHYLTMDQLDKKGGVGDKISFMKGLSQKQIRRIYNVRNLYDRFAPIGQFDQGPALTTEQMQGIYQGRSSLGIENQRSFQKAFYSLKGVDGHVYPAGHNISYTPLWVGSQGSFRIYENKYPVYSRRGKAKWKKIAPGTVSLSYQKQDMKPLEGVKLKEGYPQTTYYRWYYSKKGKKRLALTRAIYANLKDQMYRINTSFLSSHAFRDPDNLLPGTHFIMVKKCDLIDPQKCPNEE